MSAHHHESLCRHRDIDRQEIHALAGKCMSDVSTSQVTSATEVSEFDDDDDRRSHETFSTDMYTSLLNTIDDDFEDFNDDDQVEDADALSCSDDRSDSYLDARVSLSFAVEEVEADDLGSDSCHSSLFPPQEACALIELPPLDSPVQTSTVVPDQAKNATSPETPLAKQTPSILDRMDRLFDRLCISESEDEEFYSVPCSKHPDAFTVLGCKVYHGLVPHALNQSGLVRRHQEQEIERKRRREHASPTQHRAHVQRLLADRGRRSYTQTFRRVRSELVNVSSLSCKCRQENVRAATSKHVWEPCLGWSRVTNGYPQILPTQDVSSESDEGYDSDPGLAYKSSRQRSSSPMSVVAYPDNVQPIADRSDTAETAFLDTVQDSLNTTWSLVWMDQNNPVQVKVWIERGALLQGNGMIEPCLMWRRAQSERQSRFAAAPTGSLRLLQVSRIVEMTGEMRKRMCRVGTSWEVHSITGEAYTFSGATTKQRDAIVHQWKCTVARLATLAVLEDASAILDEFFRDAPPISCRS